MVCSVNGTSIHLGHTLLPFINLSKISKLMVSGAYRQCVLVGGVFQKFGFWHDISVNSDASRLKILPNRHILFVYTQF